jgi:hypothetical protein
MKPCTVALIGLGMLALGLACGCVLFYATGYEDGICAAVCSSPLGRPTSNCECYPDE